MFTTVRHRSQLAAVLLGLPLLFVGLTACGSSDHSPGGTKTPEATEQTFDEYLLDFAGCMRAQGIDYPDPGSTQETDFGGVDQATLDAAGAACTKQLGEPPVPDGMDKKSVQQKGLKAAKCFRAEGFEVPDPKEDDDGLQLPDNTPEDVIAKCYADF